MKHYYAVFQKTSEAIEVMFPDLPGCVTFGADEEEALANAVDVLAGWIAHAEPQFVQAPSSYQVLSKKYKHLVPVALDEKVVTSYQELKRFNVIFPKNVLDRIDAFRKKLGLKRSTLLVQAAEEYLQNHAV